jgi:hypothetical protein
MTNAIKVLLQMQSGFLQLESTLCAYKAGGTAARAYPRPGRVTAEKKPNYIYKIFLT